MTRSSPVLYWVLGLLGLCAAFGFYNGFTTATHRDTPAWAGGSSLSARPGQAAPPGYEPPDAQPLSDNPPALAPAQAAPPSTDSGDRPRPRDQADKPAGDETTATAVGEPKPVTLPSPTGDKPADKPKPPARPKPAPTPAEPAPAPAPEAPPAAPQPAVPY